MTWVRNNIMETYTAWSQASDKKVGEPAQRLRAQQSALSPTIMYSMAAFGATHAIVKHMQSQWGRTAIHTQHIHWRHHSEEWPDFARRRDNPEGHVVRVQTSEQLRCGRCVTPQPNPELENNIAVRRGKPHV